MPTVKRIVRKKPNKNQGGVVGVPTSAQFSFVLLAAVFVLFLRILAESFVSEILFGGGQV